MLAGMLYLSLEDRKLRNLRAHELLPRARALTFVEELDDLPEAESGVLPHADQPHPVNSFGWIAALARRSRGWRQESFALIKTALLASEWAIRRP